MTTPAFSRTFAFDASTGLQKRAPGQSALTSDAFVGTQFDQGAAVETDMVLVVNIESIDVAGGDEIYRLYVIGSNIADRSDRQILGTLTFGDAGALTTFETRDAAAGDQLHLYFRTVVNRTAFRYIDLYLDGTGATFSLGFSAFISKLI